MAYVRRSTTNFWQNNDGLSIHFFKEEARAAKTGTYGGEQYAGLQFLEVLLDLTTLPTVASANVQIQSDNVAIPEGAFLVDSTLFVEKAATSGGSATLSFGLVAHDGITTVSDTGLVSAATLASINTTGNRIIYTKGATSAGATIGSRVTTSKGALITASAATADFTAGKVRLLVSWFIPVTADFS